MDIRQLVVAAANGSRPYPFRDRLAQTGLPYVPQVPRGTGKTLAAVLRWLYRRRYHPDAEVRASTSRGFLVLLPTMGPTPHNNKAKAVATEVDPALLRTVGGRVSRISRPVSEQQVADPRRPLSSTPYRPRHGVCYPEQRLVVGPSMRVLEPVDRLQLDEPLKNVATVAQLRALRQLDDQTSDVQLDDTRDQLRPTRRSRLHLKAPCFHEQGGHWQRDQRGQKGTAVAVLHLREMNQGLARADLLTNRARGTLAGAWADEHDCDPVATSPTRLVSEPEQVGAAMLRTTGPGSQASPSTRHQRLHSRAAGRWLNRSVRCAGPLLVRAANDAPHVTPPQGRASGPTHLGLP